ncbi:MAG TPA: ABC transporter ATP-binding protein [Gemmatimonadales bacterium]|nr:ABC transporter ATP-binding protein [Gemmatimonadales bacterium]
MIRFEAAGKRYTSLVTRRTVTALEDVTLEMRSGEVFGIAGPNGAGKSTLISLLMGFLSPTAGRVSIAGLPPRAYIESHGVGYLTELVNLPPHWHVPDALDRMARLAGVPPAERGARVTDVIGRLGLGEHVTKRIKQLSKGNLQRVGLAQAMLGDAELVVLDEPTHGLDPVWTQRFRTIVTELRRPERIVLIASHNLDELDSLADRVAILDHGHLQRIVDHATDSPATAAAWRVTFEGTVDVATLLPGATPVPGRGGSWRLVATRADVSRALAVLLGQGAVLVECVPEQGRLASAFREAVGE